MTKDFEMDKELLPYQNLIQSGFQDMIMISHVINGQIDKTQCRAGNINDSTTWCPGTMSYATVARLLRDKLGFKGVIISDDMTMGAIANEYPLEIALEKAINAGVDVFIFANNYEYETEKAVNTIAKLVKEEKIKIERIEESYKRVTELKIRLKR